MLRFLAVTSLAVTAASAELTATFARDGAGDSRLDRLPALNVPAGEPATPFLTPGAFDAVWTGRLTVPRRLRVAFSLEGEGSAKLEIGGKEVLVREGELAGAASETLRLNPGDHEFKLTYRSKDDGSAALRVFWEERSFPRQTIPSSAFTTEPSGEALAGELHRRGRLLFTQHNCMKCHAPEQGLGAGMMPEAMSTGPLLVGIGDRVSEEWLRNWIAGPHTMRPTTVMPALVDPNTEEGRQAAADIAAFLAASKLGAEPAPAPDASLAKTGGTHFHELGCVACHTPPDRREPDLENARVPLNNVAFKYQPGALVAFLKKPEAWHPTTGMPNFMMSDQEANSIAAYLLEASEGKHTDLGIEFPAGDATRGMEAAMALECGVCHPGTAPSGKAAGPSLESIMKVDWRTQGCAAPADHHKAGLPVVNVDDKGREALAAFASIGIEPLRRDSSAEYARRQITALRCTACHAMDDQGSLLDLVHGDSRALTEGADHLHERVDQTRPRLTFTGEMLYPSFIERMIAGAANPRPRPWLGMRMPAYPSFATPLAAGMARMHGFEPSAPTPLEPDPALAEVGKQLLGTDGFGCTTCHGVGGQKPTAAFEVEGVNLAMTPARMRHHFYHRWMDNPQAVTPGSKMPRYSENNQSQRGDVLGGDAAKQFEAIWHYLHSVAE